MQEYRKLQERTNEDLVREYQTTHNEDLFRALLEKNTGLLHIIVMDYRIPKYEIEDLLSESYIALIKAVDNFDPKEIATTYTPIVRIRDLATQGISKIKNTLWGLGSKAVSAVVRIKDGATAGINKVRVRL